MAITGLQKSWKMENQIFLGLLNVLSNVVAKVEQSHRIDIK